ncbi:MAG TPA: tyrosine-type recombinase/integrase [Phycisphaerae bacterium]|nr:tyrosine-type recombinase/integrase [Phycisphaerae bacterium]
MGVVHAEEAQAVGKHAQAAAFACQQLHLRGFERLALDHHPRVGEANGGELPPDTLLFDIDWRNLLRTFNLDLAAAGIAKKDFQGRTVDVHSLRHTFATLLARNGVSPGVAQKLMRHSDIRLTMDTYTHLDLADTASAVAALPTF